MRSLVVYSSRTGNTKRVAEAIFKILPEMKMLCPVEEAPSADGFDFIAIGFWIDRGFPDAKAQHYMKTLQGKRIGIFGTLGSYSDKEWKANLSLPKLRFDTPNAGLPHPLFQKFAFTYSTPDSPTG